MLTLYHYVHCPFCIRVRLGLGHLQLPYQSVVLAYDNEKTPIELTGKKMLPIVTWSDKDSSNESLEILWRLDRENQLRWDLYETKKEYLENLLSRLGSVVHSLAMPYWTYTPEFDDISRQYFEQKKAKKRGPFFKLVQKQEELLRALAPMLIEVEEALDPFFHGEVLTLSDLLVAAHLWGLYVVPEFQFSSTLHSYLQSVKDTCSFSYHEDFWKEENFKALR